MNAWPQMLQSDPTLAPLMTWAKAHTRVPLPISSVSTRARPWTNGASPIRDLAQEGVDDTILLVLRDARVDREREDLASGRFRYREVAFAMAQVAEGIQEMDRCRIVDARPDPPRVESPQDLVAVRDPDDEEMPGVLVAGEDLREPDGRRRAQSVDVSIRRRPPLGRPP